MWPISCMQVQLEPRLLKVTVQKSDAPKQNLSGNALTKTPDAPRAKALRTSVPRRTPPSRNTGTLPPAACTTWKFSKEVLRGVRSTKKTKQRVHWTWMNSIYRKLQKKDYMFSEGLYAARLRYKHLEHTTRWMCHWPPPELRLLQKRSRAGGHHD